MAKPSITRILRFALVVEDLVTAERFFGETFDFVTVVRAVEEPAYAHLFGLPGVIARRTIMRLGEQHLALLAFDPPGRPYPRDSTSTDLWFQHFAIIVSDMAAAYARLQADGSFTPISETGPIVLPPSSGSVTAFKFRDGEGHPLEFLSFPKGKGPEAWEGKREEGLFLGIDHSAISVSDTAASIAFFEQGLGLALGPQTENKGPEQSEMDAVPEAEVTVTGMMPAMSPPHVELLGYKVGRRQPIAGDTHANDIAATLFVLETADLPSVVEALETIGARFVSPGIVTMSDGANAICILDPDGHRFVVLQPA